MGICLSAQTLSDEKIERIITDPPLIWRVVAPENVDLYLKETGQSKPPGFLAKLFGSKREWPPIVPQFEFASGERHEVDLDKSWDGIDFCVSAIERSAAYPNLFKDGQEVGNVEIGYGPAMCFTSDQVARLANLYQSIAEEELLSKFEPAKMKGVYLDGLWQRGDDDSRDYLTENFAALKAFLAFSAEKRLGIVIQYT